MRRGLLDADRCGAEGECGGTPLQPNLARERLPKHRAGDFSEFPLVQRLWQVLRPVPVGFRLEDRIGFADDDRGRARSPGHRAYREVETVECAEFELRDKQVGRIHVVGSLGRGEIRAKVRLVPFRREPADDATCQVRVRRDDKSLKTGFGSHGAVLQSNC
jgi:hypothetical protein